MKIGRLFSGVVPTAIRIIQEFQQRLLKTKKNGKVQIFVE